MSGRGRKMDRSASNDRGSGNGRESYKCGRDDGLMTEEMTNKTATITALNQNQNRNHNTPPPGGITNDMDNIFVAIRCTQVQRQQLVVFQLSYKERKWWKNELIGSDLGTLTYIQFCERLDARYFPATVRIIKIKEFIDVGQIRGELVDDYLDRWCVSFVKKLINIFPTNSNK
ncbi:hypothetical protein MKX01_032538 [Papaver californicum]|nr:hypothetical protein MKX01_032538 [Papaver californicum]